MYLPPITGRIGPMPKLWAPAVCRLSPREGRGPLLQPLVLVQGVVPDRCRCCSPCARAAHPSTMGYRRDRHHRRTADGWHRAAGRTSPGNCTARRDRSRSEATDTPANHPGRPHPGTRTPVPLAGLRHARHNRARDLGRPSMARRGFGCVRPCGGHSRAPGYAAESPRFRPRHRRSGHGRHTDRDANHRPSRSPNGNGSGGGNPRADRDSRANFDSDRFTPPRNTDTPPDTCHASVAGCDALEPGP